MKATLIEPQSITAFLEGDKAGMLVTPMSFTAVSAAERRDYSKPPASISAVRGISVAGLLQPQDIGQVFGTSGGALVSDQFVSSDDRDHHAFQLDVAASCPSLLEFDAIKYG